MLRVACGPFLIIFRYGFHVDGMTMGYTESMFDDDRYDPFELIDEVIIPDAEGIEADEPPGWTLRRVLYLLIALLVIASMVLWFVLPLIELMNQPPPPLGPADLI